MALARSMLQLGQPILAQGRDVTGNCYRQLGHEPIRGFDQRLLGVVLATPLAPPEYEKLHKAVLAIVREDAVCRRLMTVPGVGPLVAVTFKSAVDDPSRIGKSKAVGALFGPTPKKYQSGEKDVTGGITRTGDEMVRTALYEAANVLLSRITRFSKLKRWGMDVAKRRGSKRAKVALARKIGIILHRMWIRRS